MAKQILRLQFGSDDRDRIAELLSKNRDAEISTVELDELDKYVRVGGILSVLHLRARKSLRQAHEQS